MEPSLSPGANHRHNLSSGRVDPEHISDTFSFSSPPSDVPVNIMVAEAEAGTISDDLVVTKYKMAAEITNSKFKVQRSTRYYICMSTLTTQYTTRQIIAEVLKEVVTACLASASVRDLCMLGDTRLTEETSKAFKKDKKITKVNKHINAIIQP